MHLNTDVSLDSDHNLIQATINRVKKERPAAVNDMKVLGRVTTTR